MPPAPVPPHVAEILARPNPAVIASVRRDGTPHSAATWYDWEDGRVLLNMDASRLRLRFLRANPAVSLTVLDGESWYRHVTVIGRVAEMHDDEGLRDIDRLAVRYTGAPYPERALARVTAWVDVTAWHGWDASGAIATHADIPAS
ncbi:PPOX class F420-dependent oxidoreductase [Miltoncostaea marina]|uniref:PPOX class F420-dependent oxidoreductase n=1 Tax=Miltoncostaea marina TaxID=2843215 RepID=UPI001C3E10E5|nr:PPOX class F420-dependent oxidoreductase [Miltoncostaea marina]